MILFAGVAPGLVDGVIAQTTPTGRAISIRPRAASSTITPTDFAPARSRSRPERLAVVLAHLVFDAADAGVGHRQLGQLAVARRLDDGPAGGRDQLVDARLVVAVGHVLCGAGAGHEAGDSALNVVHGLDLLEKRRITLPLMSGTSAQSTNRPAKPRIVALIGRVTKMVSSLS